MRSGILQPTSCLFVLQIAWQSHKNDKQIVRWSRSLLVHSLARKRHSVCDFPSVDKWNERRRKKKEDAEKRNWKKIAIESSAVSVFWFQINKEATGRTHYNENCVSINGASINEYHNRRANTNAQHTNSTKDFTKKKKKNRMKRVHIDSILSF